MKQKLLCGVDIGGTKLAAALYQQSGEQVLRLEIHDHVDLANDAFTERVVSLVEELFERAGISAKEVVGVGIGFAGHVRFKEGVIITTSNFRIPFKNYPLKAKIEEALKLPVVVDNDANAQAYGEFRFGAGRHTEDMVFLTVSSGIGAGIILDKRLIRGVTGTAGEIGHTIVKYDSDVYCTCGNPGCLMALSSGIFFPELFRRKLEAGLRTETGITPETVDRVNGKLIAAGFAEKDPVCTAIVKESAEIVGIGIYNLFAMLNPEAVILGGGLMNLGPEYLQMIQESFLSHVHDMMYDRLEILNAELGSDSGLIGAAALPLEQGYE